MLESALGSVPMLTARSMRVPLSPGLLGYTTSLALFGGTFNYAKRQMTTPAHDGNSSFPARPYTSPHRSFPYTERDLTPMDNGSDEIFYTYPRMVTHIDDAAIAALGRYYAGSLPGTGRILDLCSSWISHLPEDLERQATAKIEGDRPALEVVGLGMNQKELDTNPVLSLRLVQDLNANPVLPASIAPLDAATCVVSIDYLTQPVEVLSSIRDLLNPGGEMHIVVSNRCFPTKAISRWLKVNEPKRLEMVGDFLHFAGFDQIEIVELCDGKRSDPLWVVRGRKP